MGEPPDGLPSSQVMHQTVHLTIDPSEGLIHMEVVGAILARPAVCRVSVCGGSPRPKFVCDH